MNMQEMGQRARAAARQLARATTEAKNSALRLLADRLASEGGAILAANAQDGADAQAAGLSPAMIDRLLLNESRLAGMASDLRGVAE